MLPSVATNCLPYGGEAEFREQLKNDLHGYLDQQLNEQFQNAVSCISHRRVARVSPNASVHL